MPSKAREGARPSGRAVRLLADAAAALDARVKELAGRYPQMVVTEGAVLQALLVGSIRGARPDQPAPHELYDCSRVEEGGKAELVARFSSRLDAEVAAGLLVRYAGLRLATWDGKVGVEFGVGRGGAFNLAFTQADARKVLGLID